MEELFIRYRNRKLTFEIPRHWRLATFARFADHPLRESVEDITREALTRPIGSAPLGRRIKAHDRVAIIVEDLTRASPKEAILGTLLKELDQIPIDRENITIIIALGTHRALTKEELEEAFGKDTVSKYRVLNHDCRAEDLVPIGKLKGGRTVRIDRRVHEADFRIGIGSIFPHALNGFGGGSKILFPGVADMDSILEHHLTHAFQGGGGLGRMEENPFHEEVRAMARQGRLDFIINSVLDHNDRLYELVTGHPREAHVAGTEICRRIISKGFKKKSDITVTTTFPYSEGPQIMKPLVPAFMVTKKGGAIILCADCSTPLPEPYLVSCEEFRKKYGKDLRGAVLRHFRKKRRIAEHSPPELNMSLAQALFAQQDYRVIVLSEDLPKKTVERLGFTYAADLEEAFRVADSANPDVHVIPSGGIILPDVEV
jgi:lactate racemase